MTDYNIDVLSYLVRNFFRGYLNLSLQDAEIKLFTLTEQEKFLKATVQSDLLIKYPVSKQFSKLFFKKLINYLEPYHEVHDDFYTFLCETMGQDINSEIYCFRHYIIDNDLEKVIIMKETKNMVVNGTTGMKTWEASLILTDFMLSNKTVFERRNILELGSGIGFAGVTIAKYFQPNIVQMTDCHRDVLKGIYENVEINFPNSEKENIDECTRFMLKDTCIEVMSLDWNHIELHSDRVIPDIIIGADIVYDPSILDVLCSTIKHFFVLNNQVVVYLASIIRNENTYTSFLDTLDMHGLDSSEICYDCCNHLEWDVSLAKSLIRISLK